MPSDADRASKFRVAALTRWEKLLRRIFPDGIPVRYRWDDLDEIIRVLDIIGSVELTNHIFSPHGGGLDLTGAERAPEPGCVELHYGGSADVSKPAGLFFESFGEDKLEWAYFRLENRTLKPSGVYEELYFDTHEEVTHLGGGEYAPRAIWDQGNLGYDEDGDEIPLPSEAKPVFRNFSGAFVIFAKGSIYNNDPATYDARHNKMSGEKFRMYIQRNIDLIEEEKA
jgi:YD repeat-containing protein